MDKRVNETSGALRLLSVILDKRSDISVVLSHKH